MGERGPVALPTKLKKLKGTYQPVRERPDEVEPETIAVMPPGLSEPAKTEWKRIAPELERLGLLTGQDVAALAAYCEAYAEFMAMTRLIKREGRIKDGKPHPGVRIRNDALSTMRVYLREFGLSPSSRARLVGKPKEDKVSDEVFLFGRN